MPLAASLHLSADTLLGSYRIEDVLGEGGMGIVYLATHVRLDRRVAIKVLRSEYADNEQALRRFFAEARAVNTIVHPNVIEITDFVERPGEDNYYVMELLEGASLAALMEAGGIPSLQRSVAIMTQLAAALTGVHAAGIVHRDLKPDNVVLIQRGGQPDFVKLVDFGVAKLVGSEDHRAPPTRDADRVAKIGTSHGAILGTPEYMSPQQASGQMIDHHSDIYSFGVMLYELVTGRLPHLADSFGERVVALLTVAPVPPRALPDLPHEIPPALDELIMRCLAREPAARPDTIEDVMRALERIAEDEDWIVYELNARAPDVPRITQGFPRAPTAEGGRARSGPAPVVDGPDLSPSPPIARPTVGRARSRAMVIGVVIAAFVAVAVSAVALVSRSATSATRTPDRLKVELELADARVLSGRLVGPGGDEALDHLVVARRLDPTDPGVRERLHTLAAKFAQLADQAVAAGSLAEAAAHLQAILVIDPDNAAVATRMSEIEQRILTRQRRAP